MIPPPAWAGQWISKRLGQAHRSADGEISVCCARPIAYNAATMIRLRLRYVAATLLTVCIAGCDGPQSSDGVSMFSDARRDPWQNGQVIYTSHYRIFSTVTSRDLKENLPGFMEAAYSNYLQLTNLPANDLSDPLEMYVMGTRTEWADLTEHRLQERAKLYLQLEAGGYCLDGVCVLWDLNTPIATLSVASHEGLHQFFWHRLVNRIPMWAEEGLCTVAEGIDIYGNNVRFTSGLKGSRYTDLRKAIIQGYWIELEKLLPMDGGDAISGPAHQATGYYGQVWSLVLYIKSKPAYREGFFRMLQDAQTGRLFEAAGLDVQEMARLHNGGRAYNRRVSEHVFRHYIADDLEAFEEAWLEFAKQLVDIPLQ